MIYLVRHGESAANAGLPTDDPALVPLTEKGHRQAAQAAERLLAYEVAAVIVSPYLRARQTAEAYLKLRPNLECYIDYLAREFTYLDPRRCQGTTAQERAPWVLEYWKRCDPDYVEGEGTESFRQFMERAKELRRKYAFSGEKSCIVFTHSQFINALLLTEQADLGDLGEQMRHFRDNYRWVENAEIIPQTFSPMPDEAEASGRRRKLSR